MVSRKMSHAAQSIVIFGGLTILQYALAIIFSAGGLLGLGMLGLIYSLIWLAILILYVFLIYKVYQHELFKPPRVRNS
jgi:uncharacterized membrane protein